MAFKGGSGPLRSQIPFDAFERLDFRVARVESAAMAEGTHAPSRRLVLDAGPLGRLVSVAQFALVPEHELVGRKVIACCNLGTRRIGRYESQALVLGTLHPDSPPGQAQALPLYAHPDAVLGDLVF